MKCIFTIDVEDWFHILDIPAVPELEVWDTLPSIVVKNTIRLFEILSDNNVSATCFFLGWIAEKYPQLVKMAAKAGHEVASHGYSHELIYNKSQIEFEKEARRTKEILENIGGKEVIGFRASGFSATEKTPWLFESLIKTGHKYDSSIFPAARGHGGMQGADRFPHTIQIGDNSIIELPITVAPVLGKNLCFFGGGYLRLFPYFIIKRYAKKVLADGRPVMFYIHPREIDISHPRLPMGGYRQFKSYVNIKGTENKIRRLLKDFEFVTCRNFIADYYHE
ncbi:MAG: polysaccharide deacetylase family protein [candidate division Zixibacteria bacterium]|nr:polysaccharide deacetylase family protein [candidate division Zixibacteria bacterium]